MVQEQLLQVEQQSLPQPGAITALIQQGGLHQFAAPLCAPQVGFLQIQEHLLHTRVTWSPVGGAGPEAPSYLALQVLLQHLWDGVLQHLLIPELVETETVTEVLVVRDGAEGVSLPSRCWLGPGAAPRAPCWGRRGQGSLLVWGQR